MSKKEQEITSKFLEAPTPNASVSSSIEAESSALVDAQTRPKLQEALETHDEAAYRMKLQEQYDERLNTLKHYGFLREKPDSEGPTDTPSFAQTMQSFSPEELEVASHFQKPVLLLIPETSFASKVKALDTGQHEILYDETFVDSNFTEPDTDSDQTAGWRAVIVDGSDQMEAYVGDELNLRFEERLKRRKAARKSGEKGMDRHRYTLLMLEAIRNGQPIDQGCFTLLDDDPALSSSGVPYADFDTGYHEVDFYWGSPGRIDKKARFRSSVGGDKLIS